MTLKLRILRSFIRLFMILVSLTRLLFSEKMLISNRCISGLMSNLIKKSWTVSITQYIYYYFVVLYKSRNNLSGNFPLKFQCHLLFSDAIDGADGVIFAFLQLSCSITRNSFCKNCKATDFSSQNSEKLR